VFFGNKEVSYLGFTLTPEGIKPGIIKLKAIKDAKPPTDIKMIRFCDHVQLVQDIHQGFWADCGPTIQTHKEGLGLHICLDQCWKKQERLSSCYKDN
jgi:hypothetical protein